MCEVSAGDNIKTANQEVSKIFDVLVLANIVPTKVDQVSEECFKILVIPGTVKNTGSDQIRSLISLEVKTILSCISNLVRLLVKV